RWIFRVDQYSKTFRTGLRLNTTYLLDLSGKMIEARSNAIRGRFTRWTLWLKGDFAFHDLEGNPCRIDGVSRPHGETTIHRFIGVSFLMQVQWIENDGAKPHRERLA